MWRSGLQFVQSLIVLSMAFAPVGQRWHVECADGSPCPETVRTCCHPHACATPPVDRRCVVRASGTVDRITSGAATTVLKAMPLALLPVPVAMVRAPIVARVDDRLTEHPPDCPAPKLGCAPRAPPACDC